MKLKMRIVLCMILIAALSGTPVCAAGQRQAIEENAAGQTQQETIYEIETPDTAGALSSETPDANRASSSETLDAAGASPSETETLDTVGASLPEKKVSVEPGASTTEIQELLDLNQDGTCKLVLNIPPGEYRITKTLYINPNTTIIAASGAKIIKSAYGAIIEDRLTNDDGGYDGNHDITIQGGVWDGTPLMTGEHGTEMFRFIHCCNITVKNAKLCNVPNGSHLVTLAGVKNVEVANCEFSGYGDNPKTGYLTADMAKEAVHLDVVHSSREVPTSQKISYDDLTCDTVTVKNCNFHEFSRGIGSHTAVAGMLHNGVTIENNTFSNLSDTAIRMYNYKNSAVRNNTITNAAEGIMIYTYINTTEAKAYIQPNHGKAPALPDSYNITVSGNKIKTIRKKNNVYGNGIRVAGISGRLLKGVKIQNNTVSGVENYGIWAVAAPNITISGNLVDASGKSSILLQDGCGSSVVTENKVNNGKEDGISVCASDKVTVYGNLITSVSRNGICLRDSDYCVVGKGKTAFNTIRSAGKEGIAISIYGAHGTGCIGTEVKYNQVLNPKNNGILIYKSVNTTVKGNTVSNAESNGVSVRNRSTQANISGNVVLKSVGNGIALTSESKFAKVQGNTVENYGTGNKKGSRYGIMVYKSGGDSRTNTIILKNKITGSGKKKEKNAIQISSSPYVSVSGNYISKADGSGVYLYQSSHVTVGKTKNSRNTIVNPKEYGVYVTTKSLDAKVQYNKITGAKTAGIGVCNTKRSTVKGNTITSEKDGIKVTVNSSLATVSGNTITSAGATGIWLSSGSGRSEIKGNTIKKYAVKGRSGNGIYIYQSGGTGAKNNTVISSNKITGTGKSIRKNAISVDGSPYTTLKKNTIKNAAGIGIYIFKSKKNTIEGNKITMSKTQGIYLSTKCEKAIVKSNTITKAGDVSIMLYDAPSSSVISNKIAGLKGYNGIWANASNKTTIKSNTVKEPEKTEAVSVLGSLKCNVSENKTK